MQKLAEADDKTETKIEAETRTQNKKETRVPQLFGQPHDYQSPDFPAI